MACLCNGGLFPRLFWTQSTTNLAVPVVAATITATPVLTLEPIATLSGDEVKLDSMVELSITTTAIVSVLTLTGITYRLERSTNGGAFTTLATLDIEPIFPVSTSATTTLFPNLTWVDRPGVGTHVYRIVIETNGTTLSTFISAITAETRALNALVVREA